MKPQDAFGVVVRVLGLYSLWLGCPLVSVVHSLCWNPRFSALSPTSVSYLVYIIVGAWMLRGAPGLIRFAYPSPGPAT